MEPPHTRTPNLTERHWKTRYRSSRCNLLHDFYIPVLSASARYDRVAGYFRSSSLAVASQGFSALVANGGRIRLVVGADLEPQDVCAILDGDTARMSSTLTARLDDATWPEPVANGVTLLAWMVAQGFLELRVAFRVHTGTREPLPFESVADGYVHEKWGVFADSQGNRLLMSGSLNESKTALMLNAENIDVRCDWWTDRDSERIDEADRDFESLWANTDPGLAVLPLPEAVRQRLISYAANVTRPLEIDGSSELPAEVAAPSALERLRFAMLRDGPRMPNGRYVGMETAPIEPWPHQYIVARRLIEAWPFSFLLCDEVGLGKTIENGLAFRSLYLSGVVKKILIAAPASLTRQWQNELRDKFFLSFARAVTTPKLRHEYLHPHPVTLEPKGLFDANLCIVSTGLVARKDRGQEVKASGPWDIALLDESHYARRKNSRDGVAASAVYGDLYKALDEGLRPQSAALWLATATPMQIDFIEVFDLFRLSRRVGAFQEDPELTRLYYDLVGQILRGESLDPREIAWLRRAILDVAVQDPILHEHIEKMVVEPKIRTDVRRWLEQDKISAHNLKRLSRLIFAAAPLSRVMMRHTRGLLEIYRARGQLTANLARRHVLPIPRIEFTDQERRTYEQLENYCKGLEDRLSKNKKTRYSTAFYLSFLRLRFASSLYAIARTLERRLQRVRATLAFLKGEVAAAPTIQGSRLDEVLLTLDDMEDNDAQVVEELLQDRTPADLEWERDTLTDMLSTSLFGIDSSIASSKMQALLGILEQRRIAGSQPEHFRQTVIFTRFFDTLSDIVTRLRNVNPLFAIGTYSGQGGSYTDTTNGTVIQVERDQIKHRFLRGQIDILVCTDAGAEGINLQTADLLINFDLPWNPAKVEQRIGRIDRIGQRYDDIYVQHLCYLGSAEEIVYGRLLARLNAIGAVVGQQQVAILPVTEEEFLDLAEKKIDEDEITRRAKERLEAEQRRAEEMEIPPGDLYAIYTKLTQALREQPVPVQIDSIWSTLSGSPYLASLGCEVERHGGRIDGDVLLLRSVPGVPDGTGLTVNRTLYDQGVADLEGRLHFATYGDPVFEAVLELLNTYELPACVRRLSVTPKGLDAPYVAYLAAAKSSAGGTTLRWLRGLEDTKELELDESAEIADEDITAHLPQLQGWADDEFKVAVRAHRIEQDNERAALGQAILALGVIYGFLVNWQKSKRLTGDFRRDIDAMEAFIHQRLDVEKGGLTVHNIPHAPLAATPPWPLLFDAKEKISEQSRYVENVPAALLLAGIAAVRRVADSMKKAKTALNTEAVMTRIRVDMDRWASRVH